MKRNILFFLFLTLLCAQPEAQIPGSRFSRDPLSLMEFRLNQSTSLEHPTIQPAAFGTETSMLILKDSAHVADKYTSGWKFDPVVSVSGGYQFQDRSDAIGSALLGAQASWHKEDRWSASVGYALSVQKAPAYISRLAETLRYLPGAGYAVRDGKDLYHTHIPFGHLSYKAGKYFNFEVGRGKNFWGDGYRSLILSDNTSPYPYFRITTKIWRIKYTNLFARMDDLSQVKHYADARGKYTAMHGLSWNVSKRFNISLFEMVVWQDRDSLNRRNLDLNYLNPIIFYRPVEYAQGSSDNVLLGGGFKVKATNNIQVYAQVVVDEFLLAEIRAQRGWWANKFGGQLGIKMFNVFTKGLAFQSEFNVVRPFTYTHASSVQAWGQMNQALAHPLGANFYEWANLIRYEYKGWTFREKFIWAAFGRDRDGHNQGGNIFRSYKRAYRNFDNEVLQGLKSTLDFHELMISRDLPAFPGWEVFLTHTARFQKNELETRTDQYIQVGIRVEGLLNAVTDY